MNKENKLTNIELFGDFLGRRYINDPAITSLVVILKKFKNEYRITRRKYLLMKRQLQKYNSFRGEDLKSRLDYYSDMGLDYMTRSDCEYSNIIYDSILSRIPLDNCEKEEIYYGILDYIPAEYIGYVTRGANFDYILSYISPEYTKSCLRECEIKLCFLKKNMKSIRKELKERRG